jgi:signal transduction histidine kinase
MTGLIHESRNALQRSQACLEMLSLELQDRPVALDYAERIRRAQSDLHLLFEEVREYAAPVRLQRERCDLGEIWRQAWQDLAHEYEKKALKLQECIATSHLVCNVDRFCLGQVLRNVLENAIHASPTDGTITVVCKDATYHGQCGLLLAVRDQGPGIPGPQRDCAFEPFFTTKSKGTGLGLPIAQRIVHGHGGSIAFGEGTGCVVEIFLPR